MQARPSSRVPTIQGQALCASQGNVIAFNGNIGVIVGGQTGVALVEAYNLQ
ncbi:MAG: hypothetical protein ACJ8M4_08960 [Chthoniobacterales bacterium]